MGETLRLIVDAPLEGAGNMARDEVLLDGVARGTTGATLRFYAWEPATISLGYFQSIDEYRRLEPPAGGLPVVRRTTGGGAILHDRELTYSLTLPVGHAWLGGNVRALYERMHEAILDAVGPAARLHGCGAGAAHGDGAACGESSQRGPFFCFARRHALDVVAGEAKLAGSAQRRTRAAVLQHGSLILESRFAQQPCATWAALGGPADYRAAARRIASSLAALTGCTLEPGEWSDAELRAAGALVEKYSGRAWLEAR